MAMKSFDPVDMLFLALTFVGAGAVTGIPSLNAFDGSLADMALPGIGEGISLATLTAFVRPVITNDDMDPDSLTEDVQRLDQYYVATVAVSVLGPVGWVFISPVSAFFTSSDH
jgi:hypothetical protein